MNLNKEYEEIFYEFQRLGEVVKRLGGIVQNFDFVPSDEQIKEWINLQHQVKLELNSTSFRAHKTIMAARKEIKK